MLYSLPLNYNIQLVVLYHTFKIQLKAKAIIYHEKWKEKQGRGKKEKKTKS